MLSNSFLLSHLPEQIRALPDLLDAHFLRRRPQCVVHGLPLLPVPLHHTTSGTKRSSQNPPKEPPFRSILVVTTKAFYPRL